MRILLVCLLFVLAGVAFSESEESEESASNIQSNYLDSNGKKKLNINSAEGTRRLAEQVHMNQFILEEMARHKGNSGLLKTRLRSSGTAPYFFASESDQFQVQAIHDHADFVDTVGNGEFVTIINGVLSQSRHNDYRLVMRGSAGSPYRSTTPIPMPDVPMSVLNKATVDEQIVEMRAYFEAFQKQDASIRDYKPYFKANLCYMVGAWTKYDPEDITEAFDSERHFYQATSWEDLFQKIRFATYSGTKENLENFSFMPTKLWNVEENGDLIFAQWNYEIYCHPLKDDLPTDRLHLIDDLRARMTVLATYDEFKHQRNARFMVNPSGTGSFQDGITRGGFLDKLMGEIAGPDGYGSYLEDDSLLNKKYEFDEVITPNSDVKNAAYFFHSFKNSEFGANGAKFRYKGFNDDNLWTALTTHEEILPTRIDVCDLYDECKSWEQRWVYALPLEIVYTTPLANWNPHNIEYRGLSSSTQGQMVYDGPNGPKSRNGGPGQDLAFNGVNSATFYRTPKEFFEGGEFGDDPADTTKDSMFVLNKKGEVLETAASGIRVIMPNIPGVGRIRQRYPIAPIHEDGSTTMKELSALKAILLYPETYGFMIPKPI